MQVQSSHYKIVLTSAFAQCMTTLFHHIAHFGMKVEHRSNHYVFHQLYGFIYILLQITVPKNLGLLLFFKFSKVYFLQNSATEV